MELDDLLNEALANVQTVKNADGVLEVLFESKRCKSCGEDKGYAFYSFCSRTPADIRNNVRRKKAQCRSCDSKDTTAYYRRNGLEAARKQYREEYYAKKYGVSKEISKALADPDNRTAPCPICRKLSLLVLDHDHNTGANRELICSSCNSMLGYAVENIDTLYNAIAYLKKHRGV